MGAIKVYGASAVTNIDSGQRAIYASTSVPTADQGRDGDIWIQYTP